MTVGPTHYEGWTCKGCSKLKLQHTSCLQKQRVCIETGEIIGGLHSSLLNTPSTCPYIRGVIIKRMYEIIQNERETRMNRYSSADYEGRGYNCKLR